MGFSRQEYWSGIHAYCSMCQTFFSRPHKIPLTTLEYTTIYHIRLNFPSVDGQYSCLPFLAVVNNTVMSMDIKYPFEDLLSVLLGVYSDVELLAHLVVLF